MIYLCKFFGGIADAITIVRPDLPRYLVAANNDDQIIIDEYFMPTLEKYIPTAIYCWIGEISSVEPDQLIYHYRLIEQEGVMAELTEPFAINYDPNTLQTLFKRLQSTVESMTIEKPNDSPEKSDKPNLPES